MKESDFHSGLHQKMYMDSDSETSDSYQPKNEHEYMIKAMKKRNRRSKRRIDRLLAEENEEMRREQMAKRFYENMNNPQAMVPRRSHTVQSILGMPNEPPNRQYTSQIDQIPNRNEQDGNNPEPRKILTIKDILKAKNEAKILLELSQIDPIPTRNEDKEEVIPQPIVHWKRKTIKDILEAKYATKNRDQSQMELVPKSTVNEPNEDKREPIVLKIKTKRTTKTKTVKPMLKEQKGAMTGDLVQTSNRSNDNENNPEPLIMQIKTTRKVQRKTRSSSIFGKIKPLPEESAPDSQELVSYIDSTVKSTTQAEVNHSEYMTGNTFKSPRNQITDHGIGAANDVLMCPYSSSTDDQNEIDSGTIPPLRIRFARERTSQSLDKRTRASGAEQIPPSSTWNIINQDEYNNGSRLLGRRTRQETLSVNPINLYDNRTVSPIRIRIHHQEEGQTEEQNTNFYQDWIDHEETVAAAELANSSNYQSGTWVYHKVEEEIVEYPCTSRQAMANRMPRQIFATQVEEQQQPIDLTWRPQALSLEYVQQQEMPGRHVEEYRADNWNQQQQFLSFDEIQRQALETQVEEDQPIDLSWTQTLRSEYEQGYVEENQVINLNQPPQFISPEYLPQQMAEGSVADRLPINLNQPPQFIRPNDQMQQQVAERYVQQRHPNNMQRPHHLIRPYRYETNIYDRGRTKVTTSMVVANSKIENTRVTTCIVNCIQSVWSP